MDQFIFAHGNGFVMPKEYPFVCSMFVETRGGAADILDTNVQIYFMLYDGGGQGKGRRMYAQIPFRNSYNKPDTHRAMFAIV